MEVSPRIARARLGARAGRIGRHGRPADSASSGSRDWPHPFVPPNAESIVQSSPSVVPLVLLAHALTAVLMYVGAARPLNRGVRRALATVADPPVRHYGGLKDQDRIFTNVYSRHDHGIKGAMVRTYPFIFVFGRSEKLRFVSPEATGIAPRTSSTRATRGSFRP
jgi:hypothetical protein